MSSYSVQSNINNQTKPTSLVSKKLSPSTMEQVIIMLKKQLRQCKIQREYEKQLHQKQISKFIKEIDSLKQKLLQMKEKQYLKVILAEDAQEEKIKQLELSNAHKKLQIYIEKLQKDLKSTSKDIQTLKEEKLDLNNQKRILQKQKQKHLEVSIIEKISLQQRITVLERQIQSKDNLLNILREQGAEATSKQVQIKKLQRKLIKKVNELENYEEEIKQFKQFQTQKLQARIDVLQKQNTFLKQHIKKIQHQFKQANSCLCSSNQCKNQIDMFKNKYIKKSRELSKIKVQFSKETFKEQFLKDINTKQNINDYQRLLKLNKVEEIKEKYSQNHKKIEGSTGKKQQSYQEQENQSPSLFKFTQNEEQTGIQFRAQLSPVSKYRSDIIKRKNCSRAIEYR